MSCLYYIPILTNPDCSFIAQKKVFQKYEVRRSHGSYVARATEDKGQQLFRYY